VSSPVAAAARRALSRAVVAQAYAGPALRR